jgi:heme-degrading monooxygenase HmoA
VGEVVVVSECWALDGGAAVDGYLDAYRRFLDLHRTQPGFRGRTLLRGDDDPTHLVNLRRFDSLADYEALVATDGYAAHIDELSRFLDLDRRPAKEHLHVVVADGPTLAS